MVGKSKKPWHLGSVFVLAACLVSLAGCDGQGASGNDGDGDGDRIKVVCTTTMIADLARQIAGDDAEVIGIMREGEDPHVYDARPQDLLTIRDADVVLLNGLHLESKLTDIVEANAKSAIIARLAEDGRIETRGDDEAPDPHCWMNVEYFKIYAERARDALVKADPANADGYDKRTADYLNQLDALHAWVLDQIATVPKARRVIVTSHDAFGYYGGRYEIEVHAVIGISTEEKARAGQVVKLEELVRERNVKALFVETSVSGSLNTIIRKIAQKTGASVGGELYSDSLGKMGTPAGTYVGMIRHNTQTIVEALK